MYITNGREWYRKDTQVVRSKMRRVQYDSYRMSERSDRIKIVVVLSHSFSASSDLVCFLNREGDWLVGSAFTTWVQWSTTGETRETWNRPLRLDIHWPAVTRQTSRCVGPNLIFCMNASSVLFVHLISSSRCWWVQFACSLLWDATLTVKLGLRNAFAVASFTACLGSSNILLLSTYTTMFHSITYSFNSR